MISDNIEVEAYFSCIENYGPLNYIKKLIKDGSNSLAEITENEMTEV